MKARLIDPADGILALKVKRKLTIATKGNGDGDAATKRARRVEIPASLRNAYEMQQGLVYRKNTRTYQRTTPTGSIPEVEEEEEYVQARLQQTYALNAGLIYQEASEFEEALQAGLIYRSDQEPDIPVVYEITERGRAMGLPSVDATRTPRAIIPLVNDYPRARSWRSSRTGPRRATGPATPDVWDINSDLALKNILGEMYVIQREEDRTTHMLDSLDLHVGVRGNAIARVPSPFEEFAMRGPEQHLARFEYIVLKYAQSLHNARTYGHVQPVPLSYHYCDYLPAAPADRDCGEFVRNAVKAQVMVPWTQLPYIPTPAECRQMATWCYEYIVKMINALVSGGTDAFSQAGPVAFSALSPEWKVPLDNMNQYWTRNWLYVVGEFQKAARGEEPDVVVRKIEDAFFHPTLSIAHPLPGNAPWRLYTGVEPELVDELVDLPMNKPEFTRVVPTSASWSLNVALGFAASATSHNIVLAIVPSGDPALDVPAIYALGLSNAVSGLGDADGYKLAGRIERELEVTLPAGITFRVLENRVDTIDQVGTRYLGENTVDIKLPSVRVLTVAIVGLEKPARYASTEEEDDA